MNFADLKTLVITRAIPGRVARERVPSVQRHVVSGLIDLQTFVPGLQEKNTTHHDGSASYMCGGMEVDRPSGEILEVYAMRGDVPNEDGGITSACQCRVDYDVYGIEFVRSRCREYSDQGGRLTNDDGSYVQMLPQECGFFAIDEPAGKILAYPAAVMPWNLFVRYSAIIQTYDESDDVIDLTESQIDLLILWVQAKYESDLRCWENAGHLSAQYERARRDEIYRVTNELRPAIVRRSQRNSDPCGFVSRPRCNVPYADA